MIRNVAILVVALAMVAAEAPLGNTYGPPGRSAQAAEIPSLASRSALASQHGDPASVIIRYNGASGGSSASRGRNGGSAPSSSSRFGAAGAPSSAYGAPSNSYSAPSNSYSAPSSSYSAPSASRFSNGAAASNSFAARQSAPAAQYSAPSSRNGAPSAQYSAPSFRNAAPAAQYSAPPRSGPPAPVYGPPSVRNSLEEDPLAEPANYEFSYEVQDPEFGSEFSAQESRQDESAKGAYRVLLPDGVLQVVEYEADQEGFRPTITYEETGNVPSGRSSQGPYPASGLPQGPY